MATVVLVSGPPGAGKSTIARQLALRGPRAVHLHTDDFWGYIRAGAIPPYQPAAHAQNHTVLEAVARAAFVYAAGGYVTFVDGVIGPWMLEHFGADTSTEPAVPVDYVVLRPDRGTALARALARTEATALVDEAPILQMWDELADLGELEGHVLDSTDETADVTADRVAEAVASGRLRLRSPGRSAPT